MRPGVASHAEVQNPGPAACGLGDEIDRFEERCRVAEIVSTLAGRSGEMDESNVALGSHSRWGAAAAVPCCDSSGMSTVRRSFACIRRMVGELGIRIGGAKRGIDRSAIVNPAIAVRVVRLAEG